MSNASNTHFVLSCILFLLKKVILFGKAYYSLDICIRKKQY